MGAIGKYMNGKYVQFASDGNKNIGTIKSNKAIVSDENSNLISSNVTKEELECLSGVESNVQEQINALANNPTPTPTEYNGAVTSILNSDLPTDKVLVSDENGKVSTSTATKTQLSYLDGLTGNIQMQIDRIIENMPSGGYALGDVKNLLITGNKQSIDLTWEDPENIIFNGKTIAEWEETKIVRKEGGYSANPDDGVTVASETTKNSHKTEPLLDTELANGITYFYTLFPKTTDGVYTLSDNNRANVKKMLYNPILNENSWEDIIDAINNGMEKQMWNIGDVKQITISGTKYWDGTYDAMIVDWEHYSKNADGTLKNNITFMFKQIGARGTWGYEADNVTENGWYRWYKSDLLSGLPDILKNNIATVYIQTKNATSGLVTYQETIFPNTTVEVVKDSTYNDGGTLLEYFKTNSAVANVSGTQDAGWYNCRSKDTSKYVYYVTDYGTTYSNTISNAGRASYWRPIFCL